MLSLTEQSKGVNLKLYFLSTATVGWTAVAREGVAREGLGIVGS